MLNGRTSSQVLNGQAGNLDIVPLHLVSHIHTT
jgi:hypothetical protein